MKTDINLRHRQEHIDASARPDKSKVLQGRTFSAALFINDAVT